MNAFELETRGDVWQQPFMPEIRKQIEQEFAWIERRLRENREQFADELAIVPHGQVEFIETEIESDDEEVETADPPSA
jgi:hypothetical protein